MGAGHYREDELAAEVSRQVAGQQIGRGSYGGDPLASGARGRRREATTCSVAEPLNPDNKHKLIRGIHQERNQTLVMSAEMQSA